MCFDWQSSLTSWAISTGASWYLYKRNKNYDRWNAGFITCFSTIQLLEAGIWKTDPSKGVTENNELLTKLILVGLSAQPLVQTYGAYVFTQETVLWYATWVFVGFLIYSIWRILKAKPGDFYSTIGSKGHLVWHSTNGEKGKEGVFGTWSGVLYLLGIFIPLFFMKDYGGLPLMAIGILTAAYVLYIAGPGEFGSMWCYTAIFYSVVALVM